MAQMVEAPCRSSPLTRAEVLSVEWLFEPLWPERGCWRAFVTAGWI